MLLSAPLLTDTVNVTEVPEPDDKEKPEVSDKLSEGVPVSFAEDVESELQVCVPVLVALALTVVVPPSLGKFVLSALTETFQRFQDVSSFLFSVSSLFIRIVLRFNWVIVAFLSQSLLICYVVYYIGFIYYCQLVKSNNSHRT